MTQSYKTLRDLEDLLNDDLYFKSSMLDTISSFIIDIYYSIKNVFKYNIIQRIKYGIDPRDTWELDTVITKHIVNCISHLKDNPDVSNINSIIEALTKYMKDEDYYNHDLAETAYHDLYNIIGHSLIIPHHTKFIKFIVPRLECLKDNSQGYPEFTLETLAKKDLTVYFNQSSEITWYNIQTAMITKFKSELAEDQAEAFRILTKVVFNLWD